MARRFAAFDLETAKEFPAEEFDWRPHRPLGIACAAIFVGDTKPVSLWHGKNATGRPTPRMNRAETQQLVLALADLVEQGYTLVTWNGLGFDFDILAEESGEPEICSRLALDHVDMMFHVVCQLGYPVSLEKAAQGMDLPGKMAGMSGLEAPKLWAAGQHQQVLDYVEQDVRATLALAQAGEQRRTFAWITRKGTQCTMPLAQGWLTAASAQKLPLPDTSWMTTPVRRSEFTAWLTTNAAAGRKRATTKRTS